MRSRLVPLVLTLFAYVVSIGDAKVRPRAAGCGNVALRAPVEEPPSYFVPGLEQEAEILEDRWGVPHIYAKSAADVFLSQGFNAARVRLFQIDLWRRRGLGLLSEALGPAYVEQDRAARLFTYRGDMDREWASYGPEARMAAERFVAGINGYVDWLALHPEQMPEEFRWLGITPARWQAEDVVRIRSHGLTRNLGSEIARSWVSCVARPAADEVRVRLQPEWHTSVPAGFDPCSLPDDVLRVFDLATRDVVFPRGSLRAPPSSPEDLEADPPTEGSNNWTIAPTRTSTGRPILANDPHREYSAPSLRYLAHLSAPDLDVIGAGEPSQPGISIGHNGTIAFGLTIFPVDQEDLYVYELDPEDPGRYRYQGGWESFRTVRESVPVAGERAQSVELMFTRHGPVIAMDREHRRAYAVRTAWLEPGMSPYYGNLRVMRAGNFKEFKAAMRHWEAPTENQVYADTAGNIGWVAAGLAPKRRGYDGLLPVPGDGRYEWDGFYDGQELPSAENPPEGFITTSNEMNLPPDFPYRERRLGFEWPSAERHRRIVEVLSANARASLDDSIRLQSDEVSLLARRMIPLLQRSPGSELAVDMLRTWDAVEGPDSAPAALFEVWRKRHLGPAFLRAVSPILAKRITQPDPEVLVDALEHPEAWFGPDAVAKRDALLATTLRDAYTDVMSLFGSAPWKWGDLLHSQFDHPLTLAVDDATRGLLNIGPLRRGGSEITVNASSFESRHFQHLLGASFRMVVDVGNWDASRAINTPGQSGRPSSPHYRDLAQPWSKGETFPLLYSRPAIEREAEHRIRLLPAPAGAPNRTF